MRWHRKPQFASGHTAPTTRARLDAAFWIASALSVPAFVLLATVEMLWRLWG